MIAFDVYMTFAKFDCNYYAQSKNYCTILFRSCNFCLFFSSNVHIKFKQPTANSNRVILLRTWLRTLYTSAKNG